MFSDPLKNLKLLSIRDTDVVVDLGAGTGFYAVEAGRLAPRGKVYAVEVLSDFVEKIRGKIADARLSNVEIILGNIEKLGGTKVGAGVADIAIASNVLFQIGDRDQFANEIRRILKVGGQLLLVEWLPDNYPLGPKQLAVSVEVARALFEKRGFRMGQEFDAGAHHYGMILIKL